MTIRAAQYVRMSTEKQDFSISLQTAVIAAYASANGYEVVKTYADEGVSGLTAQRRPGLQSLLRDVLAGDADFSSILVYDVSRLGRFQNPDQAAHYEFVCSEAGVRIEYCAEQFANDGALPSLLMKNIKRVMAAEYSRELSARVSKAQVGLASLGYWQGGRASYGLRRQQVFADGSFGRPLLIGDRKGPNCGRTILVPGPDAEIRTIRRIFDLYVTKKMTVRAIVRLLNEEDLPGPYGPWQAHLIYDVLANEVYIGTNVFNKSMRRLGKSHGRQPSAAWTRVPAAFVAIVDLKVFDAANARRLRARRKFTDDEMIEGLIKLHRSEGRITSRLVDACPAIPSSYTYCSRFGSLLIACDRAGLTIRRRQQIAADRFHSNNTRHSLHNVVCGKTVQELIPVLRGVLAKRGALSKAIIDDELGTSAYSAATHRFGSGRRMYALAGYRPTRNQDRAFDNSPAESLTAADAEILRIGAGQDDRPASTSEPAGGCR